MSLQITVLYRRLVLIARVSLASVVALLPLSGCKVEYGSGPANGKYIHDDVQYFPAGPEATTANSQAATERARMVALGLDPSGLPPNEVAETPAAESEPQPIPFQDQSEE
jgi:hypothetical protein